MQVGERRRPDLLGGRLGLHQPSGGPAGDAGGEEVFELGEEDIDDGGELKAVAGALLDQPVAVSDKHPQGVGGARRLTQEAAPQSEALSLVEQPRHRVIYVFFIVSHERRELRHFNVTASPTAAWMWRQLLEATPWGRQPTHLIHDRDAVYSGSFGSRLGRLGIAGVRTPVRSPKANAIAERLIRTIRTECLDHIIVFNELHLRAVLSEFAHYYNRDRPHRSLHLASPVSTEVLGTGEVIARPVLGGLHHVYYRAA